MTNELTWRPRYRRALGLSFEVPATHRGWEEEEEPSEAERKRRWVEEEQRDFQVRRGEDHQLWQHGIGWWPWEEGFAWSGQKPHWTGSNPKRRMNKCRQLMQATLFRDLGGFVLSSTTCIHYTLMISTSSYVIFVIQIGFDVYSAF